MCSVASDPDVQELTLVQKKVVDLNGDLFFLADMHTDVCLFVFVFCC